MRYHNITKDDMLNGDGLRVVLWVSGCTHECPGCHNQMTWSFHDGIYFTEDTERELINELTKEHISGVTISGGDPLHLANIRVITLLLKDLKLLFPKKTIWVYTGYTYEEVQDLEVMKHIDILVDGRFEASLSDPQLHWVGSSNQRIIDVQKSLSTGQICLR